MNLSSAFCFPLLALCIEADATSLLLTPWKLIIFAYSNCYGLRYGIVDPSWAKNSDNQQLITATAFVIGESKVQPLGFSSHYYSCCNIKHSLVAMMTLDTVSMYVVVLLQVRGRC